ncbi:MULTISPECIES: CinA family protein [Nguyenibacter]
MDMVLDAAVLAQAARILAVLGDAGLRVVTAESCTGGLVAGALTQHGGSSDMVEGGFVTYSNDMKMAVLGVPRMLLERHGAVSAEVAGVMAEGALARAEKADIAVAITGIAGPGGGSAAKPVGLVWFGVAARRGGTRVVSGRFDGDRGAVRRQAVARALELVGDCAASWGSVRPDV